MALAVGLAAALGGIGGCRSEGGAGSGKGADSTRTALACDCGTVVVAAIGEPATILPPLVRETVGRDIGDLVWERLADLKPGGVPIDTTAYEPRLAARWERVDPLTLRFHLRPGARWHDGRPVTADDVVFSFDVFSDSTLDAPGRMYLGGRVHAEAEDSATVRVRFTESHPEQLYDATYHVRVLPRHVWDSLPRGAWERDTALAHLVGSGPYRVREWRRGQFLALERAPGTLFPHASRRVVWRFTDDADAQLNLLLSHEADLVETVGAPDRVGRVERDGTFRTIRYPSAVYGFLAFRLADAGGAPHPVLGERDARRGLAMAVDRSTLAQAIFGAGTLAPPGPMSRLLWIWNDSIRTLPFDTAAAAVALDSAGWRRAGPDAVRARAGRPFRFDILIPSTSTPRRQLAVALQEAWRRMGAEVTVTAVDFPVFQQRLAQGRFDAYIGSYLDEPTPRGLADQWTRAGWGALNYGRYASPAFDTLLARAAREPKPDVARYLYREAMDTLNADAPAIFLFTPTNVAAAQQRLQNVVIDPYAWLSTLPSWTIDPGRVVARDSLQGLGARD
ncbi:MAG TPA: peptide ABC transporter substrate-binding protein [Gemmatimonadales bacterium]|nr:peptide ABC transporter substrate-binding protein [Gemmatimonadales bacterium]